MSTETTTPTTLQGEIMNITDLPILEAMPYDSPEVEGFRATIYIRRRRTEEDTVICTYEGRFLRVAAGVLTAWEWVIWVPKGGRKGAWRGFCDIEAVEGISPNWYGEGDL